MYCSSSSSWKRKECYHWWWSKRKKLSLLLRQGYHNVSKNLSQSRINWSIRADKIDKSLVKPVKGNSVVIRDIENPAIADIYTEHSQKATVAKYAPSGFYIASGLFSKFWTWLVSQWAFGNLFQADKSGKVRIWDTVNKEHILKYECF